MPIREVNREQAWLLPPSLDELLSQDHPARFVSAFVDELDPGWWSELGISLEGDPLGAGAYDPQVLLRVWLYGFMIGIRSSRKLEGACRDQIPFLWLTGMQRPDHNTLWRFYQGHRDDMRGLLRRTVRTAVKAGLIDLALQAVDGSKVGANAAKVRTYNEAGLERLLKRVEGAIEDLEAQNTVGGDNQPHRLPKELSQAQALRERVKAAMALTQSEEGPNQANLTDSEAGYLKSRQGFIAGYNAQAIVSPLDLKKAAKPGMFITGVEVTNKNDDHPYLLPMIEQAADNVGKKDDGDRVTLADAGYHSGSNLDRCVQNGHQVLMPEAQESKRQHPYHKEHFSYRADTDSYLCPQGQELTYRGISLKKGYQARVYRAKGAVCQECPAFGICTKDGHGRSIKVGPHEEILGRHRALMDTEEAKALYKLRKHLVEPVFGILKEQLGARRFLLRGLANVRSEWALIASAFNMRSLYWAWKQTQTPPEPGNRATARAGT